MYEDHSQPLVLASSDQAIELRTVVPDDAQRIYDLIEGDPNNIKDYDRWADVVYKSPKSIREEIEFVQQYSMLYRFGIWDVRRFVGVPTMVGVAELKPHDTNGRTATWVGPAYRGCGYAARAGQPLIDFAFNTLRLARLVRRINKNNIPSIKTAEKLGYTEVSTDTAGIITFILDRSATND